MLTVRRLPRSRAAIPALLGSLESTAALALAHVVAGGAAPSLASLVAFGALGYAGGLAVLRHRASIRLVLPVLLAVQVLGHAWLVALSPGHHAEHAEHAVGAVDGAVTSSAELLGLTPAMLGAHLLAAVVAGAMWALRRRAVEVVLHWADPLTVGAPSTPTCHPSFRPECRLLRGILASAPTRGPPLVVAMAA